MIRKISLDHMPGGSCTTGFIAHIFSGLYDEALAQLITTSTGSRLSRSSVVRGSERLGDHTYSPCSGHRPTIGKQPAPEHGTTRAIFIELEATQGCSNGFLY